MKFIKYITILIALLNVKIISAQTSDDILNLLVKRGSITQQEADSLKANSKVKQEQKSESQELFPLIGTTPFRVGGYIQARFQSFREETIPDGFDIHRARIIVDGFTPLWEYRLNADFASSPKLIDAYVRFKPYTFLNVTVGQFNIPLSLENVTPDRDLATVDRSQVVTALAAREKDIIGNQNGRDIGIQLSGSLVKLDTRYLLDYYVGLFNGTGINVTDNNEAKDGAGRLVIHPLKGFDIGVSYYNGLDQWATGTPVVVGNHIRTRLGEEVAYKYKSFSLQGEYIQGQDGTVTELNEKVVPLKRDGWYVLAGYYIVRKKLQLLARYDTYDPNTINNESLVKGSTTVTTYYMGGVNYYFTPWIRLQVDYNYPVEKGLFVNNDVLTTQLQIIF